MALPQSVDPTTPAGGSSPSLGDDQIRAFKLAFLDICGVPADPVQIAAALFTVVAAGLKSVNFQDAAANPATAGFLQRNAGLLKFHDGAAIQTLATLADLPTSFAVNFTALVGAIAIGQIPNSLITYAKIQDISAISKLLGRGAAAGAGAAQEVTLGSGLAMTGTTLSVLAPTPTAPQEVTFALSTAGGDSNTLSRIYPTVNTINVITVRVSITSFTGGTGGKGGSPSATATTNMDSTITHNIGRIQNVTPSLVITSAAGPWTATLKVAYS